MPTHNDHYRLPLLTGETAYNPGEFSRATIESEVRDLLAVEHAETAHERWLASDVATAFNESVYHPYMSVKYHTLLVAALLDDYRDGNEFADLRLIVDSRARSPRSALSSTASGSRSKSTSRLTVVRRPASGVVRGGRGRRCGIA